jgi:large subunit ribosomal protein L16
MKDFPKSSKYRRVFRVKLKKNQRSNTQNCLNFFNYGIKALESGRLLKGHYNGISRMLKRKVNKDCFVKYNIVFNVPITAKPLETRMGKGKAERDHWESIVKAGMIVLELGKIDSHYKAIRALKLIKGKLPFKSSIVKLVY